LVVIPTEAKRSGGICCLCGPAIMLNIATTSPLERQQPAEKRHPANKPLGPRQSTPRAPKARPILAQGSALGMPDLNLPQTNPQPNKDA
jgi:hypothetical protein